MLQTNDVSLLREENARLKAVISEQEETIIQLREALRPPDWEPPIEIGLTPYEARIIAALYKGKGEVVKKDSILYAMYHDVLDVPDIKIVDVLVCKARKKLADYGVEIKTAWGRGYYLDKASLDILVTWGVDPNESTLTN